MKSVEAELERYEQSAGVRKRRGRCKICASPHREKYERAWERGWTADSIVSLGRTLGDEFTASIVYNHKTHHVAQD